MSSNPNLRFLKKVTWNLVLAFFAAFILGGCTYGNKMSLDANKQSLGKLTKPIGIFTLKTKNAYRPSYEPEVLFITVEGGGLTRKQGIWWANKPYKKSNDEYLEYLISIDLNPGDYSLTKVVGQGKGFLISGGFDFPLNMHFRLTNGINYLGHITMINRERKEGETRSGGILPLIDQAACGFYTGTFDITIADQGDTDIPDFVRAYPLLRDANITKAIMLK